MIFMKTLITFLLAFSFAFIGRTQECVTTELLKEGTKWETTNYNKKDKIEGKTKYEVLSAGVSADKYTWELKIILADKKGEVFSEAVSEIYCENGVFTMNMEQFVSPATMQSVEEMEVEIDASDIEYPTGYEENTSLPDASIKIKAGMSGMTIMDIETLITNRKIEGTETIETEAGSFKCLKLTQTTEVKSKMINLETTSKEWFLPGFGVIRSESYDKKGNLSGYTVLTSLTKP
jgi:hypothetical protein